MSVHGKLHLLQVNVTCEESSFHPCDPSTEPPPPPSAFRDEDDPQCQGPGYPPAASVLLLATAISVVSIVTIAGNALVICSFATDRKLRTFGNYFILNLAISDLIVGVLIAVYTPYLVRGCWELTRVGCLVFTLLDYVVPLASAWNMALISLDRYWSVARAIEYRHRVNSRRVVALMTVPWIAGTLWYGPTVLFWAEFAGRSSVPAGKCFVEFYDRVSFLIACSVLEFVLPFVTVTTINVLVYVNIRRRSRGLLVVVAGGASSSSSGGGEEANSRRTLRAKAVLSRDKKSARSLAVLVVVFLVTWGPFEVCAFVNPVCSFCIPESATETVFWLLWINSTINPILYPFLQQRFRISFHRILCCCCCSTTSSSSSSAERGRLNSERVALSPMTPVIKA